MIRFFYRAMDWFDRKIGAIATGARQLDVRDVSLFVGITLLAIGLYFVDPRAPLPVVGALFVYFGAWHRRRS